MKNYLYILCAFLLAFAGCTKDADVEPIAPAPDGNTQVVLTGFSGRGTRTGFGGAEDGAVPFLWSAGDYIWARNTRSEAIAEGGSQATFVFESLETADTYDVFYNLTGPAAATALIPAEQTQQAAGELNLGQTVTSVMQRRKTEPLRSSMRPPTSGSTPIRAMSPRTCSRSP